jgi:chlorosome envelope protein F
MANNNGVFSDLFNAVGTPIQNVADFAGDTVGSLFSVAQSCTNLCATILTNTVNTSTQIIQGVSDALTRAIAPKQ